MKTFVGKCLGNFWIAGILQHIFIINSLNLSGPACGPGCQSADIPVTEQQEPLRGQNQEHDFLSEDLDELCETLCDDGLGVCA